MSKKTTKNTPAASQPQGVIVNPALTGGVSAVIAAAAAASEDAASEAEVVTPPRTFKLNERVMQAHVEIGVWTGQQVDRDASIEVTDAKNADRGAAKVVKEIVNSKWLEKLSKIATAARQRHYVRTFPGFASRGPRLLATEGWQDHVSEMNRFKAEFTNEIEHLGINWPAIREAARRSLGDLWKEEEFPTWERVSGKFTFNISYYAVPDSQNWILDLDTESVEALRAQTEERTREVFTDAIRNTYERVHLAVTNLAEKLNSYEPHGGRGTGFRDSLLNNIRDLAGILPGLNFSNDPRIEELAKELKAQFEFVGAKTLRESDITREKTAKAAEEIAKRVAGWMTAA